MHDGRFWRLVSITGSILAIIVFVTAKPYLTDWLPRPEPRPLPKGPIDTSTREIEQSVPLKQSTAPKTTAEAAPRASPTEERQQTADSSSAMEMMSSVEERTRHIEALLFSFAEEKQPASPNKPSTLLTTSVIDTTATSVQEAFSVPFRLDVPFENLWRAVHGICSEAFIMECNLLISFDGGKPHQFRQNPGLDPVFNLVSLRKGNHCWVAEMDIILLCDRIQSHYLITGRGDFVLPGYQRYDIGVHFTNEQPSLDAASLELLMASEG